MRILVYEFVTGGGWFSIEPTAPAGSLLAEGAAMLAALAADFGSLAECEVHVLHDARLVRPSLPGIRFQNIANAAAEREQLARLSSQADWTVLIAPEFAGHLLERVRLVEREGGRLLSPNSSVVVLASDKHATALHLAAAGVPVPRGIALSTGERLPADFSYPAVLKPRDGAGSLGVRLVRSDDSTAVATPSRLETFCPGRAASVACLCGPQGIVPLVAGEQFLGSDFSYQGGSLPLDAHLTERACALAVHALGTLPKPLGYLGVDLVLGDDSAGRQDFVIEINPRLTTSYVGLRRLSRTNLAGQLIAVAEGRAPELCWNEARVHFSSSGVSHLSPSSERVP
jgi:predicted ATP-grasp superfamily ATP-dependent carboligase